MNSKQMKKWLEQQGATFQPGKGSHLKVFLKGGSRHCLCTEKTSWAKGWWLPSSATGLK
jgi:hypothetical protein